MNEKIIYKVYQEFYGKSPDFSEENFENLTIEMQAMAYILSQKGVLFSSYTFVAEGYVGLKLPMSMELQDMLVTRRNKGNEYSNDESIKLQESVRKKVALIGKIVREKIEVTKNPVEMLRQIVYINIVKNRVLPNAKEDEIANISACEKCAIAGEESLDFALQIELAKTNYGKNI